MQLLQQRGLDDLGGDDVRAHVGGRATVLEIPLAFRLRGARNTN